MKTMFFGALFLAFINVQASLLGNDIIHNDNKEIITPKNNIQIRLQDLRKRMITRSKQKQKTKLAPDNDLTTKLSQQNKIIVGADSNNNIPKPPKHIKPVLESSFALRRSQGLMVGGFSDQKIVSDDIFQQNPNIKAAQKLARQNFKKQHNFELQEFVKISQQVVAGLNYKMTFNSQKGPFQIIVFDQPWTKTLKVTSVNTTF